MVGQQPVAQQNHAAQQQNEDRTGPQLPLKLAEAVKQKSQQNQTDATESNTNVDTEISKENDKINESPDINTTDDDDTLPSRPSIPMGPPIK